MTTKPVRIAEEDLDRLVGVTEAAARLGLHYNTAYRLISAGTFPVPVVEVNGRNRVSLRRLVEFISGERESA